MLDDIIRLMYNDEDNRGIIIITIMCIALSLLLSLSLSLSLSHKESVSFLSLFFFFSSLNVYWRKRIETIVLIYIHVYCTYVHNYKSYCLTVQSSSLLFELDRQDTREFFHEQMNAKLNDESKSSLYTILAISWFYHK